MHAPLLLLLSLLLHLTTALPSPTFPRSDSNSQNPTPTRPFTVAAFQSPYPPGTTNSLSGVTLRAQGGSFWLNPSNPSPSTSSDANGGDGKGGHPPGNETVLSVDRDGHAFLVRVSLILLLFSLLLSVS